MFRIVAWKSARGLGHLATCDAGTIERVTRETVGLLRDYEHSEDPEPDDRFWERTFKAIGPPDKSSGLRSLSGVRLPVASAILCVLNPAVWPVVDRWGLPKVLSDLPSVAVQRLDVYRAYLEQLNRIRGAFYADSSIHEVDVIAMDSGRNGTPVPFEPTPATLTA
jgi:hypothetical protein